MSEDITARFVEDVRAVCAGFPEVVEESAWVGVRWRVRTRTFAHVLAIDSGWPPAYARAADHDGEAVLLMFRSQGDELDVLRGQGRPFFAPPWRADEVGVILDGDTDWDEITEVLTESYCAQAPRALAAQVSRPGTV